MCRIPVGIHGVLLALLGPWKREGAGASLDPSPEDTARSPLLTQAGCHLMHPTCPAHLE